MVHQSMLVIWYLILKYLIIFEKDPLEKLAKEGQLMSYMHNGFWQCMDNKREMDMLEKYLSTGTAPWKKW